MKKIFVILAVGIFSASMAMAATTKKTEAEIKKMPRATAGQAAAVNACAKKAPGQTEINCSSSGGGDQCRCEKVFGLWFCCDPAGSAHCWWWPASEVPGW